MHALPVVGIVSNGPLNSLFRLDIVAELLTSLDNFGNIALPEPIFGHFQPESSFRLLREDRIGDSGEILTGMVPIDDLNGIWEVMGNQVPNPLGTITDENQLLSLIR